MNSNLSDTSSTDSSSGDADYSENYSDTTGDSGTFGDGGPDDSEDVGETGTDDDGDGNPDTPEDDGDPTPIGQFSVGAFKLGWNMFTYEGQPLTGNYTILRGTSKDEASMVSIAVQNVQTAGDAVYTDDSLDEGVIYYYRVKYYSVPSGDDVSPAILGWGVSSAFIANPADYDNEYISPNEADNFGFIASLGDQGSITIDWPAAQETAGYTLDRYVIYRVRGETAYAAEDWWTRQLNGEDLTNVTGNDVRKVFDADTNYWVKVADPVTSTATSWVDNNVGPGVYTYVVVAIMKDGDGNETPHLGAPVAGYRAFEDNREFISYAMETWMVGMYYTHFWPEQVYPNEPVDTAPSDMYARYPVDNGDYADEFWAFGRKGGWYMPTTEVWTDLGDGSMEGGESPDGDIVTEGEYFEDFREADIRLTGSFGTRSLTPNGEPHTYNSTSIWYQGTVTVEFIYKDAIIDTAYIVLDAARGYISEPANPLVGDSHNLGQFFYAYEYGNDALQNSRFYYTQSQAELDAYNASGGQTDTSPDQRDYPDEFYDIYVDVDRTGSDLFRHTYSIINNPFMHGAGTDSTGGVSGDGIAGSNDDLTNPNRGDYTKTQNSGVY